MCFPSLWFSLGCWVGLVSFIFHECFLPRVWQLLKSIFKEAIYLQDFNPDSLTDQTIKKTIIFLFHIVILTYFTLYFCISTTLYNVLFDPCLLHYVYFGTNMYKNNLYPGYRRLPLGYIKFTFKDIKQLTVLELQLNRNK